VQRLSRTAKVQQLGHREELLEGTQFDH